MHFRGPGAIAAMEHTTLLVLSVVEAHGRIILQTVWQTTDDRLNGARRTDIETFQATHRGDAGRLVDRLGELAQQFFPQAVFGQMPGPAAAPSSAASIQKAA